MTRYVLRRASVRPGAVLDIAVRDGLVEDPPARGQRVGWDDVDLAGRPLLPGLADHHIHLMATAASWTSVDCSPAAIADHGGLAAALRRARALRPDGWLRGVGYDVATSGDLDRRALDGAAVGPVRVQDRTGIRWTLDSVGLAAVLPPDPADWPVGIERDAAGAATGVLVRLDGWLRTRLPDAPVELAPLGAWLADRGVTAVTDAGAGNGPSELAALAAAGLPQRVTAMTAAPDTRAPSGLGLGPVKVLLDDADLPSLGALRDRIDAARAAGRPVAVHCVSDAAIVLALAAGIGRADRVEHGSVVPDDLLAVLAAADPTVVVQPVLVATKGDRYLAETPEAEHRGLHRLASLQGAGLRVAASSDGPYGDPDPWSGVAAAVGRTTEGGRPFGPAEAIDPVAAVRLWCGQADDPATVRAIEPGEPADLVVLDDGWDRLDARPRVLATLVGGSPVSGALPA